MKSKITINPQYKRERLELEAMERLHKAAPALLAACKEWMKYESEMPGVHPCPDSTMRAVYRKRAVELSKAAIAEAEK